MSGSASRLPTKRLALTIRGAVQGVGFRPFIHRLSGQLGLRGWVRNSAQGVFIEVEGEPGALEQFLVHLETEKPPRSFIQSLEASWLDVVGYADFEIRASTLGGSKSAFVLPDIATCQDCLSEILKPTNRRYHYPFTNCTNCGPRFSIIHALPYDRPNTSMKQFSMCARCQAEYEDPSDRRFHAQPNACPECGPHLELWTRTGDVAGRKEQALTMTATAIRQGKIAAIKGLGGFHLMVDAANEEGLRRLRELKHREEKPLALMFPSVAAVRETCELSPLEERLLCSAESPIVLLRRKAATANSVHPGPRISEAVAPGNPYIGVMLPYTPLHHLLLSMLGFPIVATSGNLSDEPICIDEREALERLGQLAELFLVHNRPIVRHVDDSLARIMCGRELVLRRARGYAPLPVTLHNATAQTPAILALGAHLKSTIALTVGAEAFISQHIGDLETAPAFEAFQQVVMDFESLYEIGPSVIAADLHPDYLSTRFAHELALGNTTKSGSVTLLKVQHHIAHVLSCMVENRLAPPVLGVSWDGTGYGLDGTVWGGEFFKVTGTSSERVAHLRPFQLPGGDKAVREPRRSALGLLFELFGESAFSMIEIPAIQSFATAELRPLKTMLQHGLNSPLTSSVGRLFDVVASLVGLRQQARFEGQAAMDLEFARQGIACEEHYNFAMASPPENLEPFRAGTTSALQTTAELPVSVAVREIPPAPFALDWAPVIHDILSDLRRGIDTSIISTRFHNALAEAIVAVARKIGEERVVLSGGCFQNLYLTERTVQRLQADGFRAYWHQRVPPNDGGIALGQIAAALRQV